MRPWLQRLRARLEPRLLLGLAGLVTLALAFSKVAENVFDQQSHGFDRLILLALRHADNLAQPIGPAWLLASMRDITALGGYTVITLVTVLAVAYLSLAGKSRAAILLAFAIALGAGAETLLKALFFRARPDIVPHLVEVQTLSFPSGHAMMSAITYLTLGAMLARSQPTRRLRLMVFLTGVMLTLLIGTSRVFLGVHYPTDILAGWLIGSAWALGVWLIAETLGPVGRRPRPTP